MNTLNLAGFIESQVDDFMNYRISSMGFGVPDMTNIATELRRLHAENERLRAENEATAKDAARYRLLRTGQKFSVIDYIGDTLRADGMDEAIDAAMEKSK